MQTGTECPQNTVNFGWCRWCPLHAVGSYRKEMEGEPSWRAERGIGTILYRCKDLTRWPPGHASRSFSTTLSPVSPKITEVFSKREVQVVRRDQVKVQEGVLARQSGFLSPGICFPWLFVAWQGQAGQTLAGAMAIKFAS